MALSSRLLHKLQTSPLMAIRDATRLLFSKYLLVTNTTVACGLAGTGDFITQHYEKLRRVRNGLSLERTRNQCIQVLLCYFKLLQIIVNYFWFSSNLWIPCTHTHTRARAHMHTHTHTHTHPFYSPLAFYLGPPG